MRELSDEVSQDVEWDGADPEAQYQLARHYSSLLRKIDGLFVKGGDSLVKGLTLFDANLTNINAGYQWTVTRMTNSKDRDAARLAIDYSDHGMFILPFRLYPVSYLNWEEMALRACNMVDRPDILTAIRLDNIGSAHLALGKALTSMAFHTRALGIAAGCGAVLRTIKCSCHLGNAYLELGDSENARYHFQTSLDTATLIRDLHGVGYATEGLGNCFIDEEQPQDALNSFTQALEIATATGDLPGETRVLGLLGNALRSLNEKQKAMEAYQLALVLARKLHARRQEGIHLGNIGRIFAETGNAQESVEHLGQAVEIAQEVQDLRNVWKSLWSLGAAHETHGDVQKAHHYQEAALAVRAETDAFVIGHRELNE